MGWMMGDDDDDVVLMGEMGSHSLHFNISLPKILCNDFNLLFSRPEWEWNGMELNE